MASGRLVFIIDPPESLDPPTDTSLALMREGLARGLEVFWAGLSDLYLEGDDPRARVHPVRFVENRELFLPSASQDMRLGDAAMVFMRKDPPVDLAYMHATLILERLPPGVLQINPPHALRTFCEKLIPSLFPGLAPDSLVSGDPQRVLGFLEQHGHIVIKPLEDCSGHGVYALRKGDPNAAPLIRSLSAQGRRYLQAQRFLPEIEDGDKRVLLLDGDTLGWVRRVPGPGDFRSNVNAGGVCRPCDLTENDRRICAQLAPWLRRERIVLAGVDIVGEFVLEVNITSPSCLREINALTGQRLEKRIFDLLLDKRS